MYKVVLLDLDNTILDFSAVERLSFFKSTKHYGIETNEEDFQKYLKLNVHYWELFEVKKMSINDVVVKRFSDYFGDKYPNVNYVELNDYYLEHLADEIVFIDNAIEMLVYLRNKGYKLYIVSNGVESVQNARLAKSHLLDYVDGAVYSGQLGFAKPDKEFYEAAANRLHFANFNKKEMIMIGDSLTSDIKGANNYGVDCIWFNPKHLINNKDVTINYDIDDLRDIYDIL